MIRIDIQNDLTGDGFVANYDVRLYMPQDGKLARYGARVVGFERSRGWQALAELAVTALAGEVSSRAAGDSAGAQRPGS